MLTPEFCYLHHLLCLNRFHFHLLLSIMLSVFSFVFVSILEGVIMHKANFWGSRLFSTNKILLWLWIARDTLKPFTWFYAILIQKWIQMYLSPINWTNHIDSKGLPTDEKNSQLLWDVWWRWKPYHDREKVDNYFLQLYWLIIVAVACGRTTSKQLKLQMRLKGSVLWIQILWFGKLKRCKPKVWLCSPFFSCS